MTPTKKSGLGKIFKVILVLFFIAALTVFSPAMAQGTKAETPNAAQSALILLDLTAQSAKIIGDPNQTLSIYQIIGSIINIVLGFVGVIFLVLIIYGGVKWMVAGFGNGGAEDIKKSRTIIMQAFIGLMIVLGAFVLTNYVVFKIIDVVVK